jgi:hypothetical protein
MSSHLQLQNRDAIMVSSPPRGQTASDPPSPEVDQSLILPQQADTVLMAILCCQHMLPPNATVMDCLQMYLKVKTREIDAIGDTIGRAFEQRLQLLEDELIGEGGRVPANSEENA